jgi:hypothetical protein
MNNANSNIQFEIEHASENNQLNLLDIKVTVHSEGNVSFEPYKKPAKRDVFLNFNSALPMISKVNIVKNERDRILTRCSNPTVSREHNQRFNSLLLNNGYTMSYINQTYPTQHQRHRNQQGNQVSQHVFYVKMPFINNREKIFKSEGITVRFYHDNPSLKNILRKEGENESKTCRESACSVSHTGKCFIRNIVYKIVSKICQKSYIGSTIRHFHTRIAEHRKRKFSYVHRHFQNCIPDPHNDINYNILARDPDPINLRLKEVILIKQKKPEINSKEEMLELRSLI